MRVQIQGSKEGRESVSLEGGEIQRREGERREFKSKVQKRAQVSCLAKGGRQGEGPGPRYRGGGFKSKVYKREGE